MTLTFPPVEAGGRLLNSLASGSQGIFWPVTTGPIEFSHLNLLLVDNCIPTPSLNSCRTHFLPVIFSIGSDPNNRNKNSLTTLIHFSHIYSHTYPNLYISFLTPYFIRLTTIVNPYIYIFVSHSYLFSKIKKYFQNKKYNFVLLDNWINISNFDWVILGNTDFGIFQ